MSPADYMYVKAFLENYVEVLKDESKERWFYVDEDEMEVPWFPFHGGFVEFVRTVMPKVMESKSMYINYVFLDRADFEEEYGMVYKEMVAEKVKLLGCCMDIAEQIERFLKVYVDRDINEQLFETEFKVQKVSFGIELVNRFKLVDVVA